MQRLFATAVFLLLSGPLASQDRTESNVTVTNDWATSEGSRYAIRPDGNMGVRIGHFETFPDIYTDATTGSQTPANRDFDIGEDLEVYGPVSERARQLERWVCTESIVGFPIGGGTTVLIPKREIIQSTLLVVFINLDEAPVEPSNPFARTTLVFDFQTRNGERFTTQPVSDDRTDWMLDCL